MELAIDFESGAAAVCRLRRGFDGEISGGIIGVIQTMPEEEACKCIESELERLLLLPFTAAIDCQRDAHALWAQAKELHDDPSTRWVFNPGAVQRR